MQAGCQVLVIEQIGRSGDLSLQNWKVRETAVNRFADFALELPNISHGNLL